VKEGGTEEGIVCLVLEHKYIHSIPSASLISLQGLSTHIVTM